MKAEVTSFKPHPSQSHRGSPVWACYVIVVIMQREKTRLSCLHAGLRKDMPWSRKSEPP